VDFLTWPGQQQVFQLVRSRTNLRTGEVSWERMYGITRLSSARADAAYVLDRVRNHWILENGPHYVRDVTFVQDHSQVHTGSIPQVMDAFCNTAIILLRSRGETNIARACSRHAVHPWQAFTLLGIVRPDN
jgi:hypothetical protein